MMKNIMVNGKPLSQMSLGTVQLGMNYGIANDLGQPDVAQSTAMLSCALKNGITSLDTARAYGTSEDVLGNFFKENPQEKMPFITSKLGVGLPENASDKEVEAAMYASVETSLNKLGVNRLDCLLLHSPDDMTKYGDIVPKTLDRLVKENYTAMAGVSVYLADEVETMLQNDVYQAIQVPMSIFDQKLITGGYIDRLKAKNVVVFVRSVFLQGLVFHTPEDLDPRMDFCVPYLKKYLALCAEFALAPDVLALSHVLSLPGVTCAVLGCDNEAQLAANCALFDKTVTLTEEEKEKLREAFTGIDPRVINPGLWFNA